MSFKQAAPAVPASQLYKKLKKVGKGAYGSVYKGYGTQIHWHTYTLTSSFQQNWYSHKQGNCHQGLESRHRGGRCGRHTARDCATVTVNTCSITKYHTLLWQLFERHQAVDYHGLCCWWQCANYCKYTISRTAGQRTDCWLFVMIRWRQATWRNATLLSLLEKFCLHSRICIKTRSFIEISRVKHELLQYWIQLTRFSWQYLTDCRGKRSVVRFWCCCR